MQKNELRESDLKKYKKSSVIVFIVTLTISILLILGIILGVIGFINLFSDLSIN